MMSTKRCRVRQEWTLANMEFQMSSNTSVAVFNGVSPFVCMPLCFDSYIGRYMSVRVFYSVPTVCLSVCPCGVCMWLCFSRCPAAEG